MSRFKKEVKLFGKEFMRQGSILLFGKAPKKKPKPEPKKISGAQRQYEWGRKTAKRNGWI